MRMVRYFPLMLLLTACALGEGLPPTPAAPLTLEPPPDLTLVGDCNISSDLADWLQFSTYYAKEFTELVSETAAKSPGEMYADVILMGKMRADFSGVSAPDCAEPAHRMMVVTMTRAIDGFQAYVNGEADSLGNTVAEVLGQFDQLAAIQADLNRRLEAQLQAQQTNSNP